MRRCFLLVIVAALTLSVVGVDHADARRFGGGHSFGKQHHLYSPQQHQLSRRSPIGGRAAAHQRGSAASGLMGMLAGLALGGLIGSMLFGGPFEGVNLLDMMVLGVLAALLIWFLRRKAEAQPAAASAGGYASSEFGQRMGYAAGRMLRPDIDEQRFLQAAREVFVRLQAAWDAGDLDEIRRLCTPEVVDTIEQQMRNGERHQTEVVTVDAKLADSWIEAGLEWVAVDFVALLREKTLDAHGELIAEQSGEVHETWIFQHDPNRDDPTWFVAGIQQR